LEEVLEEKTMTKTNGSDKSEDTVEEKTTEQENKTAGQAGPASTEPYPTPIWISARTWTVLLLGVLVALVLLMWLSPSVPIMLLGGFALALVISFPVRVLSRFMPRGWAILTSFLILVGLAIIAIVVLVPILITQLISFISNVPAYATSASQFLRDLLEPLAEHDLLPSTPEEFMANLGQDLLNIAQNIAQQILGGLVGFISGTFNLALTLFGILFVAAYLVSNVQNIRAVYVSVFPIRYRQDAQELWDAFAFSLSRYLSGLGLVALIQGAISAVALFLLGVPYAILLGVWVSITSIIPYLGAFLGAIPAVILALFVSPTTALLTAIVFLVIQQLEGNILTPRIQGQTLRIPSVVIFLAVIAGGEIAGLLGVIFAVPTVAVLKELFDFFRVRLRTRG
jgi:predicted PurR-regulated permease PerM